MTHPRLHRAFLAGVRWAEAEGAFIVQLGTFRGWLDVEDTAFFATAYDAHSGELELSDRSRERLDATTLSVDPDQVLRCIVKGRFAARFTRPAQAHVLDAVDLEAGAIVVRVGRDRVRAPALDALA